MFPAKPTHAEMNVRMLHFSGIAALFPLGADVFDCMVAGNSTPGPVQHRRRNSKENQRSSDLVVYKLESFFVTIETDPVDTNVSLRRLAAIQRGALFALLSGRC